MPLQLLHPESARAELEQKSFLEIERETAETWGARAAAAFELARETAGSKKARWLADAENYRQESLEHAAMTCDLEFIEKVISELDEARVRT